jgi:hypothetical protein
MSEAGKSVVVKVCWTGACYKATVGAIWAQSNNDPKKAAAVAALRALGLVPLKFPAGATHYDQKLAQQAAMAAIEIRKTGADTYKATVLANTERHAPSGAR